MTLGAEAWTAVAHAVATAPERRWVVELSSGGLLFGCIARLPSGRPDTWRAEDVFLVVARDGRATEVTLRRVWAIRSARDA